MTTATTIPASDTDPSSPNAQPRPASDPAAPLFILFNEGSGSRDATESREAMRAVLATGRREHEFVVVRDPHRLPRLAERTVALALENGGAVVAAGGDGTINALAQAAVPAGCVFGIVPQGTFNYTPRAHGIPLDTALATRALLGARVRPVQVGLANGRVFLVNASLGLYPQLLEDREAFKRSLGRHRATAVVSGLFSLLQQHRQLTLEIEHDHERELVRAHTLFVGNNALQLEQVGFDEAEAIGNRRLAGVLLRPVSSRALLGLALRGALGTLGAAEQVRHFPFRRMSVRAAGRSSKGKVKVALDGEIQYLRFPIQFEVSPRPLLLLAPPVEEQAG